MAKQTKGQFCDGFTMLEAIVTLAIIGLMIGVLLTGVGEARQRFLVRDAAQQFASDVRQAILQTKNAEKAANCVNPNPSVPRECSNYFFSVAKADSRTYLKKVAVTGGSPAAFIAGTYRLPGSVLFSVGANATSNLSFNFSTDTFPFTNVGASGAFSYDSVNRVVTVTLVSAVDGAIKTNVCVFQSGTVLVQSTPCTL